MKRKSLILAAQIIFLAPLAIKTTAQEEYTASNFSLDPPLVATSDPLVMISLSVELTQQAEAYTGAEGPFAGSSIRCPGRMGTDTSDGYDVCYSPNVEYIGYFDPNKCYQYITSSGAPFSYDESSIYRAPQNRQTSQHPSTDSAARRTGDFFRPVSLTNNRSCSGNQFSGNYMNWSTMTALDTFRHAMMGGARVVDTAGANAQTLLTRTHRYSESPAFWTFVPKILRTDHAGEYAAEFNLSPPSQVSPFNDAVILEADNNEAHFDGQPPGNRVNFYDGSRFLGGFNVIVEVCNPDVGLEPNCVEYTDEISTWYKPEGVMQENAYGMRFALTTYSSRNGNNVNGGVLRANAKYLRHLKPNAVGRLVANTEAEINSYGQFVLDPDGLAGSQAGVQNSGILNYISNFGLGEGEYKNLDPFSELYYESLRYIMNLGRTPEYADGLNAQDRDNFPVINDWDDPQLNACQDNFIIGIGDQFTHADGDLPGTSRPSGAGSASGEPSNATTGENGTFNAFFNVTEITNPIGLNENYPELPANLGVSGTTGRGNTYYTAGMANWARTNDIRPTPTDTAGMTQQEIEDLSRRVAGEQFVKTFIVDTQEYRPPSDEGPKRAINPLWLAAKYGGFDDIDDDDMPDGATQAPSVTSCVLNPEWDADGDCEPDAYTLASQPANLVAGLRDAFNDIAAGAKAGSSAGVVSTTADGQGMVVQGLFTTRKTSSNSVVEWGGMLHALFVDESNNIREDTNSDQRITDDDAVVRFAVDQQTQTATITRYTISNGSIVSDENGIPIPQGPPESIDDLNTIWDARTELARLQNVRSQREPYSSQVSASGAGRAIYTGIDTDDDGMITEDEKIDFDDESFPAIDQDNEERFRLLGLKSTDSPELSSNIVNFIRGENISGFRNREIEFDDLGRDATWRLGDIVNSSPLVLGAPKPDQRYDLLKNDESYEEFYEKYSNRRQVVYTGANDGMLHAFNAGFFDEDTLSFSLQGDNSETPHPLGAELWGYVPYNVLPHLRWLTEKEYPHVFYVDGIPQAFDVNIFNDDEDHPNGWGTILVVGMRFGGAEISVDPNSDDDSGETQDDDITFRSAFIVLDITNPEKEPELIAEISHPQMGFTTGRPAVVKYRNVTADDNDDDEPRTFTVTGNEWHLLIGSGPFGDNDLASEQALKQALSNQSAKIFAFDLRRKQFHNFSQDQAFLEVDDADGAFIGDMVSADWVEETNGGYADDAVYFGTISGDIDAPSGDLRRLILGNEGSLVVGARDTRLLARGTNQAIGRPFSGMPFVRKLDNQFWVYTGSGRFYNQLDQFNENQNGFYGVREPLDLTTGAPTYGEVTLSSLANVEDVGVIFQENEIDSDLFSLSNPASNSVDVGTGFPRQTTFAGLRELTTTLAQGWFFDFEPVNSQLSPVDIQALHAGRSDGFGSSVAFTEYKPSGLSCDIGRTFINIVHFQTGTAAPFAALRDPRDTHLLPNGPDGEFASERSKEWAEGFVRDVKYVDGKIIGQGGAGTITDPIPPRDYMPPSQRVMWREININW